MSDNKTKTPASNRRVCERLDLSRKLLLELGNGEILFGKSRDISLRGVLMETDDPPEAGLPGSEGTLFVIADDGQHSNGYACKVVRLVEGCIALELDKKDVAPFGQYLTKYIFGR